jgi:putrescine transport system substrate-binding protein
LIRRWAVLLTCLLSILPLYAHAQEKLLNIYGWPDYIDFSVLQKFAAETGAKVQYDVYDSLPMLEATLTLEHPGYDIVMPTNEPTFSRLIRRNLLAPIDRSRVPNWKNLDPELMKKIEPSDPGNKYGAIYLWGTLGLGMLPDKVKALAPNAPLDSLDLLFKPENAQRLESCGITMLDSPTLVVPPVLRYLGLRPDSTAPEDLAAAEHTLMAIRPYIRTFSKSSAIDALATGSSCLALAYSGNVLQGEVRAKAARRGVNVRYVVPKGGAQVTFDMLAIPVDAPHKELAHAFIDFILRPEIIASITNVTRYANAVPASHPMVDPELLADTSAFPTDDQMRSYFTPSSLPVAPKMARNRMWTRFKEGH